MGIDKKIGIVYIIYIRRPQMANNGMYLVPFKNNIPSGVLSTKGEINKNRDFLTGMVDMDANRYRNMTLKEACIFRIKEEYEAKKGLGINPNLFDIDKAIFVNTKNIDKFYQKSSESFGFEIRSTIESCISNESPTEIIRWKGNINKNTNPSEIFYQFIMFKDYGIKSDFIDFLKESKHDYKPTTPQKKDFSETQKIYSTHNGAHILMKSFTGYGKTWGTIYSIVNIEAKKNFIHTYKVDVMESWYDEFNGDIKFYKYFKGNIFIIRNREDLDTFKKWYSKNGDIMPFALIASDYVGKKMSKSTKKVFRKELADLLNSINFDTCSGDECHYGQYNDHLKNNRLWNLNSKLYIDISATPLPNLKFRKYDSIIGQSLAEGYAYKEELLKKEARGEVIPEEDRKYLGLPYIHCIIKPLRMKLIRAYQSIGYNQFNPNTWWEVASLSDRKEKLRLDASRISSNPDDVIEKTRDYYNLDRGILYDLQNPDHIIVAFSSQKAIDGYIPAAKEFFNENDKYIKTTILETHSPKEVRKAIEYCKTHTEERVIIATIKSGLTGISNPSLCKLSFECNPSSILKILQSIGRLTRKYTGKEEVFVYFNSIDLILSVFFEDTFGKVEEGKENGRFWKDEKTKKEIINLLRVLHLTPFDELGNLEEFDIVSKYEEFYQNCIGNINNLGSVENTLSLDMMSDIVNKFLEGRRQKKISYRDKENITNRNPGLNGVPSGKKRNSNNTQVEDTSDDSSNSKLNKFITVCKYFRTFLKYCKEHFNETDISILLNKIENTYSNEFKSFVGFDYFTDFSKGINMDMCQEILNQSDKIEWYYDGNERVVTEDLSKNLIRFNHPLLKDTPIGVISGGYNIIHELNNQEYSNINYYSFSKAEDLVIRHISDMNGISINYTIYSEELNNKFMERIYVGNPPYLKDTFLKITEKILEKNPYELDFVMPSKWLEDPLKNLKNGYFKRYENSVAKKISDMEVLPPEIKNKEEFDIEYYGNLAIYRFYDTDSSFDYEGYSDTLLSESNLKLLNILRNSGIRRLSDVIETNKKNGIRIPVTLIAGNRGKLPIYKELMYTIDGKSKVDGEWKDWTKCKNMGGYDKKEDSPLPNSIPVSSTEEAVNFYNSIKTDWYRNLCDFLTLDQNIPVFFLPWMGDTINPRTGLKGYLSDWTNEDFIECFGA